MLSHNQDRMYLFDSLDERKMLYNMPFKFILNGVVDIGDLQQALDIMIERHETLQPILRVKNIKYFNFVKKQQ